MGKNTTLDLMKINLLNSIYDAASIYKTKMVGKTFMYVFDDRFIEVTFKTDNFKHLCGIDSRLTSHEFYNEAITRKLEKEQINFTPRHPFEVAKKKLKHLKNIYTMSSLECFIQEDISTDTATYKFATTDLSFSVMLSEDLDSYGIKRSEKYISKSLRDKDAFDKSRIVHEVTHIFVKQNDKKYYSNVTYYSNTELPVEVLDKLSSELREKFKKKQ